MASNLSDKRPKPTILGQPKYRVIPSEIDNFNNCPYKSKLVHLNLVRFVGNFLQFMSVQLLLAIVVGCFLLQRPV